MSLQCPWKNYCHQEQVKMETFVYPIIRNPKRNKLITKLIICHRSNRGERQELPWKSFWKRSLDLNTRKLFWRGLFFLTCHPFLFWLWLRVPPRPPPPKVEMTYMSLICNETNSAKQKQKKPSAEDFLCFVSQNSYLWNNSAVVYVCLCVLSCMLLKFKKQLVFILWLLVGCLSLFISYFL